MFRKPMRLEKWIAFDGAVGVEAAAAVQDADADDAAPRNDSGDDGTSSFAADSDGVFGGDSESSPDAVFSGVNLLEAGSDGPGNIEVDFEIDGVGSGSLEMPGGFVPPDGYDGGIFFPFDDSEIRFTYPDGAYLSNVFFEITNPENGEFFVIDRTDLLQGKYLNYGLERGDTVLVKGELEMTCYIGVIRDWGIETNSPSCLMDSFSSVADDGSTVTGLRIGILDTSLTPPKIADILGNLAFKANDGAESVDGSFSVSIFYKDIQQTGGLYGNYGAFNDDEGGIFDKVDNPPRGTVDLTVGDSDSPPGNDEDSEGPDPEEGESGDPDPDPSDPGDTDPGDPPPEDPDPPTDPDPEPSDPGDTDPGDPPPEDPDPPTDPDPEPSDPGDTDPEDPPPEDPDPPTNPDPEPSDPGDTDPGDSIPDEPVPPTVPQPDPSDPQNPVIPPPAGDGGSYSESGDSNSGGDSGSDGDSGSGDPGGDSSSGGDADAGSGGEGGLGPDGVANTYRREADRPEGVADDERTPGDVKEESNEVAVVVGESDVEAAATVAAIQMAHDLEAFIILFEEERETLESALSRLRDEYFSYSREEWGNLREFLRGMFDSGNRDLRELNRILEQIRHQIDEFRSYAPERRDGMLTDSVAELLDSAVKRNAETAALTGALNSVADFLSERRLEGKVLPGGRELSELFEQTYRKTITEWRERNARSDPMGKELAGKKLDA